jgi:hypothetical protein
MKHSLILALAAITLAGCEQQQPTEVASVPAPRHASVNANSGVKMSSSISVPISTALFVPCTNIVAGTPVGEQVGIRGQLDLSSRLSLSAAGSGEAQILVQPQGLSGLGFVTGTKYVATGTTQFRTSFATLPFSSSAIASFKLNGQGGSAFQVIGTLHYSIDASGQLAASLDNTSVVCTR